MQTVFSYDGDLYSYCAVMDDPNIEMVLIGYTLLLKWQIRRIHYNKCELKSCTLGKDMGKNQTIAADILFAENTRNPEYQEILQDRRRFSLLRHICI